MLRRSVLTAALTGLYANNPPPVRGDEPGSDGWRAFKTRFVSDDGRIIDNGNGGVSHSEGQGWGLIFAVEFDDRAYFGRIYEWTKRALGRPKDALHAWRFVPTDHPPVRDLNNATDGDIFIAAALARAGHRWGLPNYLHDAAAIARDIVSLLLRQAGAQTVLLPGLRGFETETAIIINPSYYAFPMIPDLAKLAPSPQWDRLQADGQALIERCRFGQWQLPPDWLQISKTGAALSPAPDGRHVSGSMPSGSRFGTLGRICRLASCNVQWIGTGLHFPMARFPPGWTL
jgi:endoglucanase